MSSYEFGALVHILIDKTLFALRTTPVICNNHRIGAYCVLDVLLLVHRAKLKPNPLPNLAFLYIRAIFRGWCQFLWLPLECAYVMIARHWLERAIPSHEFKIYVCREHALLQLHIRGNILKINEVVLFFFLPLHFIFISHTPSIFFVVLCCYVLQSAPTHYQLHCINYLLS